jgi:hypothetical protein
LRGNAQCLPDRPAGLGQIPLFPAFLSRKELVLKPLVAPWMLATTALDQAVDGRSVPPLIDFQKVMM